MKRSRWGMYLVVVLLSLLLGCSNEEKGKPKAQAKDGGEPTAKEGPPREERGPTPVRVFPIETRELEDTVEAVGTILPFEETLVSSETAGVIERLYADEGHPVRKGQLLAKIEDESLRLRLEEARTALKEAEAAYENLMAWTRSERIRQLEAQLNQARIELDRMRKEHDRYRSLYEDRVIERHRFDQIVAQYEIARERVLAAEEELRVARTGPTPEEIRVAQARIDRARASVRVAERGIQETSILSPVTGVISVRMVSAGEYVKAGTALFKVIQPDPAKVLFSVPEGYAGQVRNDQRVRVSVKAYSGEAFEGRIHFVSPEADPKMRHFQVKALIPNRDGRLKPGFFTDIQLVTGTKKRAKVVPEEAIYLVENAPVLYLVRDGKVVKEAVQIGKRFEGKVEVLSERLRPDDRVVVAGPKDLKEGLVVETREKG